MTFYRTTPTAYRSRETTDVTETAEDTKGPDTHTHYEHTHKRTVYQSRPVVAAHSKGKKMDQHKAPHDSLPSNPEPLTAPGPDGRPWFAAFDDEDAWRQFAERHTRDVDGPYLSNLFCKKGGGNARAGPGPIGDAVRESCAYYRGFSATKALYGACKRATDSKQCMDDAVALIEGRPPLRPVFPADYGETVASRSGIELEGRENAQAFIDEANVARLCVLTHRMTVITPLERAGRALCFSRMHQKSDRFNAVYSAARRAGASRRAAVRATQLVEE